MGSAKKNTRTPLHLLHELADSLVINLEKACTKAQAESEKALLILEKQIQKTQKKYLNANEKLQIAIRSDKTKSLKKTQKNIAKLDKIHVKLVNSKEEVQSYLSKLKKDSTKALTLAKGIIKVKEKVAILINNEDSIKVAKKTKKTDETLSVVSEIPLKKTRTKKVTAVNTGSKQIKANTTKRTPIAKKTKTASNNASDRKSQGSSRTIVKVK